MGDLWPSCGLLTSSKTAATGMLWYARARVGGRSLRKSTRSFEVTHTYGDGCTAMGRGIVGIPNQLALLPVAAPGTGRLPASPGRPGAVTGSLPRLLPVLRGEQASRRWRREGVQKPRINALS